jgi:uncharacterized protein (TIGR02145 family)
LVDAGNYVQVDCSITVSTTAVSSITSTLAASGGKVNYSSDECNPYGVGVCWSTSPNPTTVLTTKTSDYSQSNDGTFSSFITGLTPGTTYYVRAYSTGSGSPVYGNEVSFTTTTSASIKIGTQTWTDQNLDVATYSDGTLIPKVTDKTEWANLTTGAWCYLNNTTANGTTYGKLYNWYAVAGIWNEASKTNVGQRKKLAPTGYHIPSDSEWTTLTTYLGGENVAAVKMRATVLWYSAEATNSSGFSGLPGGNRGSDGTFSYPGNDGSWWSSSAVDTSAAWYLNLPRYLYYYNNLVSNSSKTSGLSVRCLKD